MRSGILFSDVLFILPVKTGVVFPQRIKNEVDYNIALLIQ